MLSAGIQIPGEILDAVDGMVGDAGEHLAQIGFGIEADPLRSESSFLAYGRLSVRWSRVFAVLWISLPAFSHCDKVLAAVLFQHSLTAPRRPLRQDHVIVARESFQASIAGIFP
jgi:hypothetical protein